MDFTGTAAAASLASLIVSLINCLFGFRLQKFWVGVVCFFVWRHGAQPGCVPPYADGMGACGCVFNGRRRAGGRFVPAVFGQPVRVQPGACLADGLLAYSHRVAGACGEGLFWACWQAFLWQSSHARPSFFLAATGGFSAAKSAFLLAGADTGQQQCILGHGSRWAGGLCAGGRVPVPQHKGINGPPHVKTKERRHGL